MRKRGSSILLLLMLLLLTGCTSYFDDKVRRVEIGMVDFGEEWLLKTYF